MTKPRTKAKKATTKAKAKAKAKPKAKSKIGPKTKVKTSSKIRGAALKKSKTPKKRSAGPRAAKTSRKELTGAERRKSPRLAASSVWVTEYSSDYRFVVPAGDISEGGIFLLKRMKTSTEPSLLTINAGDAGAINLRAFPIYDRVFGNSYGTGYQFLDVSPTQAKALRTLLRELD